MSNEWGEVKWRWGVKSNEGRTEGGRPSQQSQGRSGERRNNTEEPLTTPTHHSHHQHLHHHSGREEREREGGEVGGGRRGGRPWLTEGPSSVHSPQRQCREEGGEVGGGGAPQTRLWRINTVPSSPPVNDHSLFQRH